MLTRIRNAFRRRRVKVEITCPHGEFIPGSYTPGLSIRRYGCRECGMTVRLTTVRGPVNW